MRRAVLVFFVLTGPLRGAQAPDTAPVVEGEKGEEQTRFTAERLSTLASRSRQAFLNRFAGKTLDIRGTVVSRDLTNGVATVQIWHGSGPARADITCRSSEHASLQAAAVLSENQEIRVSASVSAEGSGGRGILLSPCVILTNSVNVSPTAELTAPYARDEAKKGPPQGRYRCAEETENTFTGWLTILPRSRYTQPTGEPGRYKFDEELIRVFFRDGSLRGWQAEFSVSSKGRILMMTSPEGAARTCRWLGDQDR